MRSGAVMARSPLSKEQMANVVGFSDIASYQDQVSKLCESLVSTYYQHLYGAVPKETVSRSLSLADGSLVTMPVATNAGTSAILAALAPVSLQSQWQQIISGEDPAGFLQTYRRLFPYDDPLDESNQVIPSEAPPSGLFKFPFTCNDTWAFTSGPHEYDGCNGGDPFSAVDFVVPGVADCTVPADRWITAPAAGTVSGVACGGCQVSLTYQGGWGSRFFHVANPQVSQGQSVSRDQRIGNPSQWPDPACGAGTCGGCEGYATAVHEHFDLQYNGAFVAIDGTAFEGWVVHATETCRDGYLEKDGVQKRTGTSVKSELCTGCCGCSAFATTGASSATDAQAAILANLPALRNAFARPSGTILALTSQPRAADIVRPSPITNLQGEAGTMASWHNQSVVRVHWTAAQDAAGSLAGYAVTWSQDPQTEPPVTALQPADTEETTSPPLTTGRWYVHVRAVDRAGNAGATAHAGPFLVDVTAPAWPDGTVTDERAWQTRVDPLNFTWPAAVDEAAGVAGYRVYWGEDSKGTAEIEVDEPAYTPPVWEAPAADTVRYLRAAPLDNAGNRGEWRTVAVWRYDAAPPAAVLRVNSGGETVRSLNVTLNLTAEDAGSGIAAMRFSTDGAAWTPWEPYAPYRAWQLEDRPDSQAVYAQVKDAAGNLSEATRASATAVLNVDRPSSANYRVVRSVLGMGGGAKTSTSYRVEGTSGQLSRGSVLAADSYRVSSGFWAGAACPLAELVASPDISVDQPIITLMWNAVAGASAYRIYRGTEPYFAPGTPYDNTTDTTWMDLGGAGDPLVNHTYVVKAINTCGESSTMHRVGEFDFALTPGK
jgi:murein DD-endopeptidase MepM/ murein hydrolase activator NlpD